MERGSGLDTMVEYTPPLRFILLSIPFHKLLTQLLKRVLLQIAAVRRRRVCIWRLRRFPDMAFSLSLNEVSAAAGHKLVVILLVVLAAESSLETIRIDMIVQSVRRDGRVIIGLAYDRTPGQLLVI